MVDPPPSSSTTGNADVLPFATLLHMITIKLSSHNYLLWKAHVLPLLACQDLMGYVDGSIAVPPPDTVDAAGKKIPNPALAAWKAQDQCLRILLQSSLSEEAMAEILGLETSQQIWNALAAAYSRDSVDRAMQIKTELSVLRKGTGSVSDYGRKFKACCDNLAAIGKSLDETEKSHMFLRGLGPSFQAFSTALLTIKPIPNFRELLSQAESQELYQRAMEMEGAPVPNAAFAAHHSNNRGRGPNLNSHNGRKGNSNQTNRGNNIQNNQHNHHNYQNNQGRSGGQSNNNQYNRCYVPTCQLCDEKGHIAKYCKNENHSANLAETFGASCSINPMESSDWYVNSGASAHMTNSTSTLDSSTPYSGLEQVAVGNESENRGPHGSRKT